MSGWRRILGGVLVALPVAAWLGWWGWAQWRWHAALRAWEAARGPFEYLPVNLPDARPNATALELTRAAAALGIGLAPMRSQRWPHGSTLSRQLREAMSDYLQAEAASTSPGLAAPPRAVADFIDDHAGELDEIVGLLERGNVPRWDSTTRRVHQDSFGLMPHPEGHEDLQRILYAAGLHGLHRGRPESAARLARASAVLGDAVASRPEVIAQIVHRDCARMRHPLIRGLPADVDAIPGPAPGLRAAVRAAAQAEFSLAVHDYGDAALVIDQYASHVPPGKPLVRVRQACRGLAAAHRMRRDAGALVSHWQAVLSADEELGSCGATPPPTRATLPRFASEVTLSRFARYLNHLHLALQAAAVGEFDEELTRVIVDARRTRRPGIVPGSCSRWSFDVEVLADGRLRVTTLGEPPRPQPDDARPPVATTWVEPRR